MVWDDTTTYFTCTMAGDGNCNCGGDCGACEWAFYGTTDATDLTTGNLFGAAVATNTPWYLLNTREIAASTSLFTDESGYPTIGVTWPTAAAVATTDWVITVHGQLADYQAGDIVNGAAVVTTIESTATFQWEILNPCRTADLIILAGTDITYTLGTTQQTGTTLGQNYQFEWDSTAASVTHNIADVAQDFCGDFQWYICPGTLSTNAVTSCCTAGTICPDTAGFDRDVNRLDFGVMSICRGVSNILYNKKLKIELN